MNLDKEKLTKKINQDIANAQESIGHVVKSKNYYVAGELKCLISYMQCLIWEIEHGNYDQVLQQ